MILIFFLIFISLFLFGSVELWSFSLVQILIGIISLIVLIKAIKERRFSIIPYKFFYLFLFILAIIALQIIPLPKQIVFSLNPEKKVLEKQLTTTLETVRNNLTYSNYWIKELVKSAIPDLNDNYFKKISLSPYRTKIGLLKGLSYFLIFISSLYLISNRKTASKILILISITGFIAALVGFLNHYLSPEKILWLREGKKFPFFAPFYNANNFAAFEVIIIPILLGIIFSVQRNGKYFKASKDSKNPLLILYSFFAIIIFIGIFFSLSRAGMILSICSFLFLTIIVRNIEKNYFIILISVIVIVILLLALMWIGLSPIKEEMLTIQKEIKFQGSLASRYEAWSRSLNLLKSYWLIGSGASTFSLAFQKLAPFIPYKYERLHNDYLQFAIENGIFTFIILLFLIFLFFQKIFNYWKELNSQTQKIILISLLTSISLILLYSIFDFPLQIGSIAILFIILISLTLCIAGNFEYCSSKSIGLSKISAFIFLLFIIIILYNSVKEFTLDYKRISFENKIMNNLNEIDEKEMKFYMHDISSPIGYYAAAKKKLSLCVKEIDAAISFNKAAKINLDTAWKLKLDNHLQEVVWLLLKAIILDPMNSEYWVRLGQSLELIEWVKELSQPIDLEQLQPKEHKTMGELSKSAELIYKNALELDPINIDACQALGKLYYKNGKFNEAIQAFSLCTKIRPWDDYFLKIIKQISQISRTSLTGQTNQENGYYHPNS